MMKTLNNYLKESIQETVIDGHIHCIGGKYIKRTSDVQVCALNDWPDSPRETNYPEFEKFFNTNRKDIVLGVGANDGEMLTMLNDSRFNGYGEILSYKILKNGKEHKSDTIELVLKNTRKPVYVHYDLTETSFEKFESIVKSFPNNNIVLCHCGISRHTDDDFAYFLFKNLIEKYDNLWGDVSWHTLTYFVEDVERMKALPTDRIICGTDCSERDSDIAIEHRIENFNKLRKLIKNESNIKKLFNL